MRNMTVSEFMRKHAACKPGRSWAVKSCKTMRQVWEDARPGWLVWVASRPGVLTQTELRRFLLYCADLVEPQLPAKYKAHRGMLAKSRAFVARAVPWTAVEEAQRRCVSPDAHLLAVHIVLMATTLKTIQSLVVTETAAMTSRILAAVASKIQRRTPALQRVKISMYSAMYEAVFQRLATWLRDNTKPKWKA